MQRGCVELQGVAGRQLNELCAVPIGNSTGDHVKELYAGMLEGHVWLGFGLKGDQIRLNE